MRVPRMAALHTQAVRTLSDGFSDRFAHGQRLTLGSAARKSGALKPNTWINNCTAFAGQWNQKLERIFRSPGKKEKDGDRSKGPERTIEKKRGLWVTHCVQRKEGLYPPRRLLTTQIFRCVVMTWIRD